MFISVPNIYRPGTRVVFEVIRAIPGFFVVAGDEGEEHYAFAECQAA